MVSFIPRPLYSRRKIILHPLEIRLMGLTASVDAVEKAVDITFL
jgi:hypothetical protein